MVSTFRRRITRLSTDQRGTSLVEFAFVVPFFALLVVGIGDLARGFSEKYALQQVAHRTLELAHLGSESNDYEYLVAEARAAAAEAGISNPTVALRSWRECNGNTNTPMPWLGSCPDGQQTARYLTLRIDSTFRPAFGSIVYAGANADGSVPISASASLRVQ
jgi:hypothetical protein